MAALPEHDASAIVGEIFSALVITSTLGAEINDLEATVAGLSEYGGGMDAVQTAAEEALALAAHERGLRMHAQTKLRHLNRERNAEATVQQRRLGALHADIAA